MSSKSVAQSSSLNSDFAQLAKIALTGGPHEVQLFLRRMTRRYREQLPELSAELLELLQQSPTRMSPLRKGGVVSVPVDSDSRLELLRIETSQVLDIEPAFTPLVSESLSMLVKERQERGRLAGLGIEPTRTVLFTGAPGVGKSLAARWLAREVGVPLLTLDLSAVMSSFLGRTGNNLRQVMEYAKGIDCILLLDELDAIAKRRDDVTEVGELKRLVTVLLQEVDNWPTGGLIVAATNHPALLDPAVWRRFEKQIDFPLPDDETLRQAVHKYMNGEAQLTPAWDSILVSVLRGLSFSDIERLVTGARRDAAITETPLSDHLTRLVKDRAMNLSHGERTELAAGLVARGVVSQRDAYELTGISRDTIRKAVRAATTSTDGGEG